MCRCATRTHGDSGTGQHNFGIGVGPTLDERDLSEEPTRTYSRRVGTRPYTEITLGTIFDTKSHRFNVALRDTSAPKSITNHDKYTHNKKIGITASAPYTNA